MARPTKLTPETQQKITQAIQMGATYEHASQFAGITYETFNEWMKKGQSGEKGFSEFSEAVKNAEGRAVVGWLAKIEAAANDGNWQAAAWKLERRYPEIYGKQRIEHTGKNGEAIAVDHSVQLTIEERRKAIRENLERDPDLRRYIGASSPDD